MRTKDTPGRDGGNDVEEENPKETGEERVKKVQNA